MRWMLVATLFLAGCSAQVRLGPDFTTVPLAPQAGVTAVEEPDGEVVYERAPKTPIEVVITGLRQAQTVRTLTRQLAR